MWVERGKPWDSEPRHPRPVAAGVRSSYGYDACGKPDAKDGDAASLTTGDTNDQKPLNPYRYTGKRLDSGTAGTGETPWASIRLA